MAQLRSLGQGKFADLIDARPEGVAQILFAHLNVEGAHWTLQEHDLRESAYVVTSWDSLSGPQEHDLRDQIAIAGAIIRGGCTRKAEAGVVVEDTVSNDGSGHTYSN